jgi:cell division ATPase FtsA
VEEAELMAGIKISDCVAGIAGAHKEFQQQCVVAIREKEVRRTTSPGRSMRARR